MQQIDTEMQRIATDRRAYPILWDKLNEELRALEHRDGNLINAVGRLREHQLDKGFIRDDLHAVKCYSFPHQDDPARFLSLQYNPARVNRLRIRVGAVPPSRGDAVNDSCFLCGANIQWQHRGIEFGYAIEVNGTPCNIWMNAYPLMPLHIVVATRDHIPQAWDLGYGEASQFSIDSIVRNLAILADRLPGYVGFYNGEGAGTSVPAHFHYQFFKRRDADARFPLELAPVRPLADAGSVIEDYPVESMRWSSTDRAAVVTQAAGWIDNWLRTRIGLRPELSANIFVMTDADGGRLRIYFVPRDKALCHSPHMAGMIGSLEILGELVLTTENEKHDLDRDQVNYASIARILADIRVPL